MAKENKKQQDVIIYRSPQGVSVEVRLREETVWLDAHQISEVFNVDRTGVVRHINNIYKTNELPKEATCAKIAQVAKDGRVRKMDLYNLDMIISVGYRVNSKQATAFRVWATSVLKKYLIDGYAVNEKRLEAARQNFTDLQSTIQLLASKISSKNLEGKEQEIFSLLSEYSKTLSILEQYDKSALVMLKGAKSRFVLSYKNAKSILDGVRRKLAAKGEAGDLFAQERGSAFEGIVKGLYQTFGGKELYKSIESKAAHLLYFVIKDHPFSDGNKRSAAFLFVYFLDRNKHLYKKSGEKKLNDNALAALALLVAESDPNEKETMVKLIMNLITE